MMTADVRWRSIEVDEPTAQRIADTAGVPLSIARLLVARGIAEPDAVETFLNPRLSDMRDPFLLPDVRPAADRISKAIAAGELLTVFGDFDADGVTSCALLTSVLRRLGGDVSSFLPNRVDEGYGFSQEALGRCLAARKPGLIVTVDCGTCSVESVNQAKRHGVDVVVSDHHEVSGATAPAVAVVNPKLGNDDASSMLAGVGVAFKLCHALIKDRLSSAGSAPEVDLRDYLDLVALGTVADVVPLLGENRILVRHGLRRINDRPNPGLAALIAVAGVQGPLSSYHLAFVLGPRVNAAGRMGDATTALELLLTDDPDQAARLAGALDRANADRKMVEDDILETAAADVDQRFSPAETFGVVTGRPGWHVGAIGIVASRLCSRYNRPCVVVSFDDDGTGRGSCRSIEGAGMLEMLEECSDLLEAFGGHDMAAGLTVRQDNFEAFRDLFNDCCRTRLSGLDLRPVHEFVGWLNPGDMDDRLLAWIDKLAPTGMANPDPVWGLRGLRTMGRPRVVGGRHLKMTVAGGGTQMDAIGFGMADRPVPDGPLDMLFQLKENTYLGRRSLQLQIRDFR